MPSGCKFINYEKIGNGGYGVIYKATSIENGKIYALKQMDIPDDNEGIQASSIREICILRELRHPNIIQLSDVIFVYPKITLVLEYCLCDLKQYIKKNPNLLPNTIQRFCREILLGIEYLHDKHILHRDLKPQNLLVSLENQIKISDFGLSRIENIPVKKYAHEAASLWYRSPDAILGSTNYKFSLDMWAVGCILAEMVLENPLFRGNSINNQMDKIFRILGYPTQESWPSMELYPLTNSIIQKIPNKTDYESKSFDDFLEKNQILMQKLGKNGVSLLKSLLEYEPSRRITARQALQHPYFTEEK